MKITIVQLVPGWDMRRKHDLRESLRARNLRPGEIIVAINRALDMARIIDCEGGCMDRYAYEGEEFDLERIAEQMRGAYAIDIDAGQHERPRARAA